MINGNIYDVNGCYNGGSCDFFAKYKKQTTSSVEVKTEISNDWAVSAGVKVEGEIEAAPMGVGVSTSYKVWATGKYGKKFSNDQTNRTTISVSVEVEAREDDRIYSTIADYDIWEYPVFHGNEQFSRRSYFALVPKNVQATWYGSKSYFAQQYVPDHEVSNILSYYPYDTLSNNPNLAQIIRASYVSDRFSLDGSSSYDWNLSITDFEETGADTTRDMGIDAGVELGGFESTFKFDNQKMSTHTTTVENLIDLQVHLGSVNMSIGDVKYAVTPYAYWGTNDALVVDYAVQPELAPPGFPETWWQDTYGNIPDPAFILPWRLDPEKGFALGDPEKRFQTKDITFVPRKPQIGDTLTITARVRNFSLISTSSPVSVKFYLEDPDSGGTPIIGVNGTNTVNTNGIVPLQGKSEVNFKWVLPNGLPAYPKIYAILDQENATTEIHDNNNKGFNILGSSSVSGIDDSENYIPDTYVLYQSYPNPFNPSTTIKYSIPNSDKVSIKVYDILGREVSTLVNEYKTAGTYSIEFNASWFASGIYFYQIHSGNFVETKKMVLIK
jgi:Secretion system C-terminal sorting domain